MASFGHGEVRVVALVGPYQSGKTSLLESILAVTGQLTRRPGTRVFGDTSPEARTREMGVELNVAHTEFMGERYAFIDCPGSVEFLQETLSVLPGVDAAIIVTEPDDARIFTLAPLLHAIEQLRLPRFIVFNKVDKAQGSIRAAVEALASVSGAPVVLRHIPIREEGHITGYVDLAAEQAHLYRPGQPSEIIPLPEVLRERVLSDRMAMLEQLADFDDHLLEELLDNLTPSHDEVFHDLALDVQQGKIAPVLLAAATLDEGTRRLLKALRHELPPLEMSQARLGVTAEDGPLGLVLKTIHTPHGGKLSVTRLLRGALKEGDTLDGQRVAGLFKVNGQTPEKLASARAGDLVGLGKLDMAATGQTLGGPALPVLAPLTPVFTVALSLANRNDEVKLSGALAKLAEEDPSLSFVHHGETGELLLSGQGEVHLAVTLERLKSRFGLDVRTHRPQVAYRETIRKGVTHHARHKKQSGGHGQFGDVTIEVQPQVAPTGFSFTDRITGGAIPRQYIPSVEEGVRAGLKRGPLGFPVVDVAVTLTDGKFHAVDSSDMAFQTVGRQAIAEALPLCAPVLLEPIQLVRIHVPSVYTAKANQIISTRRGHILGFDVRDGWPGWDTVDAHMPEAELHDLIIELRSLTEGAGTYEARFDHHTELVGRLADAVVAHAAA
ncbi:elongation factor G [Parapedomonas caeni]